MAIKILKLTSIEDVIGDYEEKDGECTINKPAKIMMLPTEGGDIGMAMISWAPFSKDEDITIRKECILTVLNPSQDIKNEYNHQFGSGIVAPSKDLIV